MKERKNVKSGAKSGGRFFPRIIRAAKYCLFVLTTLVIVSVSGYYSAGALMSSFMVERVIFEGNTYLSDEELLDISGIRNGISLLTVNGAELHKAILSSPWIRTATVRKEFPSTLVVLVREAEPRALLDMKGRLFIVDDTGTPLEELSRDTVAFLPVIGSSAVSGGEVLPEALNLAGAIKKVGLVQKKDHIEITGGSSRDLAVNVDGIVVKVGEGGYEDKLMRLAELEGQIAEKEMHIDYIDLRFANRAIVKPMQEVIQ